MRLWAPPQFCPITSAVVSASELQASTDAHLPGRAMNPCYGREPKVMQIHCYSSNGILLVLTHSILHLLVATLVPGHIAEKLPRHGA